MKVPTQCDRLCHCFSVQYQIIRRQLATGTDPGGVDGVARHPPWMNMQQLKHANKRIIYIATLLKLIRIHHINTSSTHFSVMFSYNSLHILSTFSGKLNPCIAKTPRLPNLLSFILVHTHECICLRQEKFLSTSVLPMGSIANMQRNFCIYVGEEYGVCIFTQQMSYRFIL